MFEVFVSHKPNCYLSAPKKFERLVSWWTVKQTGVTWVFQSCLRGLLLLSREPNCCQAHSCWHATGMKWKHTYQFNKCIYTQIDFRFGPNIQRCELIREKSQRNDIEQKKRKSLEKTDENRHRSRYRKGLKKRTKNAIGKVLRKNKEKRYRSRYQKGFKQNGTTLFLVDGVVERHFSIPCFMHFSSTFFDSVIDRVILTLSLKTLSLDFLEPCFLLSRQHVFVRTFFFSIFPLQDKSRTIISFHSFLIYLLLQLTWSRTDSSVQGPTPIIILPPKKVKFADRHR